MYTDEYEERGFPIRSFLIKFIIIVVIILLLIWLLPKFIKPKNDKKVVPENNKVKEEEIYQKNINSMQKAAFKYYNADNLPKEDNKYKQVTLQELIDEDYIKPLKEVNGKKINSNKSYIKITKVDENEYILKINIKDTEIEDYVLLTVGHFDYCKDYICEMKEETKEEKKAKEEEELKEAKVKAAEVEGSSSESIEEQNNNQPVILDETFKYTKTIPAKLSDWSNWSDWRVVGCGSVNDVTCNSDNSKCLKEIKTTTDNGSCVMSIRTRKVLVSGYTVTRYSTENNKELLNDGWVYIGK